jgi:hypothetical protein
MASKRRISSDGKDLEAVTETVFRTLADIRGEKCVITRDIELPSPHGPRQIDVLIESEVVGMKIRTIVECRDYARKIDIAKVDAMVSLMRDVGAHKAVFVSRKGFSKGAASKASLYGIELCTLNDPKEELKRIGIQIPIVASRVVVTGVSYYTDNKPGPAGTFLLKDMQVINGIDLCRKACGLLTSDSIVSPLADCTVPIDIPELEGNAIINDECGRAVDFGRVSEVNAHLRTEFYFGYIDEIANKNALNNLSSGNLWVFVEGDKFAQFWKHLRKFNDYWSLPRGLTGRRIVVTNAVAPECRTFSFPTVDPHTGKTRQVTLSSSDTDRFTLHSI